MKSIRSFLFANHEWENFYQQLSPEYFTRLLVNFLNVNIQLLARDFLKHDSFSNNIAITLFRFDGRQYDLSLKELFNFRGIFRFSINHSAKKAHQMEHRVSEYHILESVWW